MPFGRGKFKQQLPPGGYAWTGSDALTDICPECRKYAEIKMDDPGCWMCTACYQAKAGQNQAEDH